MYVNDAPVWFWPRFAVRGGTSTAGNECIGWDSTTYQGIACSKNVDIWITPNSQAQVKLSVGCKIDAGTWDEAFALNAIEVRTYFSATNPPIFQRPLEAKAQLLADVVDGFEVADLGFYSERSFDTLSVQFLLVQWKDAKGESHPSLSSSVLQSIFQLTPEGTLAIKSASPLLQLGPGELKMTIDVSDGRDLCVKPEQSVNGPCDGSTTITLTFYELMGCPDDLLAMTLHSYAVVSWEQPIISPLYVVWSQSHLAGHFPLGHHTVTYSTVGPNASALCTFKVRGQLRDLCTK